MAPGYSKVLINEYVVPDFGAAWPMTSMDWLMMALGGGQRAHRETVARALTASRVENYRNLDL